MAEQKKTSHGQAFNLEELVEAQIETWVPPHPLYRWVPPARSSVLGRPPPDEHYDSERERPAAAVRPDIKELFERKEELTRDEVRTAFLAFLETATWRCHRCQKEVEPKTLKVPPPEMQDGKPAFHIYCSSACAAA